MTTPPKPKKGKRRTLKIPSADTRIDACEGWELFDRSEAWKPEHAANPLWPSMKAVHVERRGKGGRGTGRRAYWLRFGVMEGRFRRCPDNEEFKERFPAVHAQFEARCRDFHTPEKFRHMIGEAAFELAVERMRLSRVARAETWGRGTWVEQFRVGGWAIERRVGATNDSPLWPAFRAVAPGRRVVHIRYSVVERRLRVDRSLDARQQSEPDIANLRAYVLGHCEESFTEASVRAEIGHEAYEAEKARLEQSAALWSKNPAVLAERYERAHELALVEDQERSKSRH